MGESGHNPKSPGKQREHGALLRTQAYLRHLAVPLQRQQRVLEAFAIGIHLTKLQIVRSNP